MKKQINEIDQWVAIRSSLNNSYDYSGQWNTAVMIFQNRILTKYFNAINNLIHPNTKEGEGFAIVTLQCALIEMFAAFKKGAVYNHGLTPNSPAYEYKNSSLLFTGFLTTAAIFEGIFHAKDKAGNPRNTPFSAASFYAQVRCGLMHEAKTKGNWHINATSNDNPSDRKFIKQKQKGNVIYRTLLQYALEAYFRTYLDELQNPDPAYNPLRRVFARKMDNLYDIKDNFEWWTP
ncbi:hypothetical protein [Flavobacterium sp. FlaQc-47]|uniref:hypothetical protein n=1 Tax=Flavobacterium sp. FlaQc-47 TaxID=3374180 RepID=UPI0037577771